MVRTTTPAERRAELDRRLEAALKATDGTGIELARSSVRAASDRWHGQLLVLSHSSAADTVAADAPNVDGSAAGGTAAGGTAADGTAAGGTAADGSPADVVFPAATTVELLRGYCRLRSELFVQLGNDVAHSLTRDPGSALLAGDYLNSAAYAVLGSVDHPRVGDAFETLLSVSESLACAFDARHGQSAKDHCSFLDETAGSLGEGAVVIGATLAGVEESTREQFATLGRGFSTARQIQRHLRPDAETDSVVPPEPDVDRLREHGERRLAAANRALDDLAATADVAALRAFVENTLTAFDSTA